MFDLFRIVENRRYYFTLSLLVILLGVLAMIYNVITLPTHTPWRLSVDFLPGNRFELKFNQPVSEEQIRRVFQSFGVTNPAITRLGDPAENTWQVRTAFVAGDRAQAIRNALAQEAPMDENRTQIQSVSPTVAAQVTQAAIVAVVVATVAILLFVWWSFRKADRAFRYSACAIAALIHDILIAAGITAIFSALFNWEIDALFLTAMLTVLGFSIQDTIVVYDRIRENLTRRRGESFETIVTRSLLETLNRSLTTSLINILVLTALLLFGGASIKQFVAVLLIGMISGTYSSIFVAVPLVVAWFERDLWGTKQRTPQVAIAGK
ncbi:MAG: protein translocase subunit SecF [Chloroflexi bacterium]|jgi:preprotein translocase SecF subunit|uniref:Protein-export membrane protein SecF n=1 Tax=Candidatus Thermofonsia Clade 3 bacterium TaxID=2364212 RepID=A0A2M8QGW7_9CHLR|nr:protein translocase subunit SecF [Candidatus Roseilinea sp. NK_OTU-006]PJF49050.1 MAG: protein translocase subunit SecF [Candidatus Thermofonsia Clade 3 bacterium]RMG62701.1 MAG: protein translocase subunit SecF [Chloroflexota bacterium]